MKSKNILDYSYEDLINIVSALGQPTYRAKQLYDGLQNGLNLDEISTLPKGLIESLKQDYSEQLQEVQKLVSADGTQKFLFRLSDNQYIESVYLPNNYGGTVCVSTQVGCRMNCLFCASGLNGLERNLSSGEILGQVLYINRAMGGNTKKRSISNVVLMGSGEPLDNLDNVIRFVSLATADCGINISKRNISISTCGLVEAMYSLADSEASGITLTISLHASTDESRRRIMPIASKYTMQDIIRASRNYFDKTGRRIVFEYALIKGINTNHFDAKRLSEMLRGLPCHINLIRLNHVKERGLVGIGEEESKKFAKKLVEFGLSATIRKSQGSDILGACGQLRNDNNRK